MWTRPLSAYRIVLLGLGCALFVYLFIRTGATQIYALMLGVGWNLALIDEKRPSHRSAGALISNICSYLPNGP